jgi:predicted P-loop ATPase
VKKRGEIALHPANIALVLRNDERWKGIVAFDEFAQLTLKREPPPYAHGRAGEWEAEDDSRTAMWLATHYGMTVTSAMVTEAVETVAREQRFHPVVEHLRALTWDGVPRNASWLARYCNAEQSDYVAMVGVLFLRGMVRRVMQPGCKFDYCLVLEGAEGLRKSTLAAVLGGEWGSDTPLDLGNNREASAALHGRWVMEFSEMESVTRAEAHLQKSFLSRTFDQYRPVYSRRNIKVPRQCVFIGTTNETEYIKEGQGARRFWPITVGGPIDIDGLRQVLPQLLAEAVHDIDAGERCYPSEEDQRALFSPEQMKRVVQESLIDALHDWVLEPDVTEQQARAAHGGSFSLADAAFRCLKVSYAQLTRDLQTRVGKALAALGCERQEKRNGMTRYWYKPPQKAATSGAVRRVQEPGEDDVPIPF